MSATYPAGGLPNRRRVLETQPIQGGIGRKGAKKNGQEDSRAARGFTHRRRGGPGGCAPVPPPCFNPASCHDKHQRRAAATRNPRIQRLGSETAARARMGQTLGHGCLGGDAQRDGGMAFSGNPRAARSGKKKVDLETGRARQRYRRSAGTKKLYDYPCGEPISFDPDLLQRLREPSPAFYPFRGARFHQMAENGVPHMGSEISPAGPVAEPGFPGYNRHSCRSRGAEPVPP